MLTYIRRLNIGRSWSKSSTIITNLLSKGLLLCSKKAYQSLILIKARIWCLTILFLLIIIYCMSLSLSCSCFSYLPFRLRLLLIIIKIERFEWIIILLILKIVILVKTRISTGNFNLISVISWNQLLIALIR